jgi:ferric enterobactin receptor
MRSAVMVKYIFTKNNIKLLLAVLLFLISSLPICIAQKYIVPCNNISLSEVLNKISRQYGIKVAFDAQKLGSVIVNKKITADSTDELIANLLKGTGFDFQLKYGRYLIFDNKKKERETELKDIQLIGSVRDEKTLEELPYASVYVPGQNQSAFTTENGNYFFKKISKGPVKVLVNLLGYFPVDTVIYPNASLYSCNIFMKRKVQVFDTVVIKVNKLDMIDFRNNVEFATTINPEKLIDLPILTETDIFKTLQLLPGINYSENSSELCIRGGSGDQNLVLYDGQTLYNLSHFYGVFSSINPNVVKDIQVYKGGYDSRYGERVSGVVDINGKSGNQVHPTIYGDLNLVSGNAVVELPVTKKLTVLVAGRRSYSDIYATQFSKNLFEKPVVITHNYFKDIVRQSQPSFRFYDLNTKLTYRISDNEEVIFNLFGGRDYLTDSNHSKSDSDIVYSYKNTWQNFGISAAWMKQWENSFFTYFQVGGSGYSNNYNDHSMNPMSKSDLFQKRLPGDTNEASLPDTSVFVDYRNKNRLTDYSISLKNTYSLNEYNKLDFGLLVKQNHTFFQNDNVDVINYDSINQTAYTASIYAQDRISVFRQLIIKPGIRASFYTGNRDMYLEPRLSVNYKLSDLLSFRLATGNYCQFISEAISQQGESYNKNFWVLADDSVHPVLKSTHLILGSTFEYNQFLLDIEPYYKQYSGLQEYIFNESITKSDIHDYTPGNRHRVTSQLGSVGKKRPSIFFIGEGKSYGIDFMVRFKSKFYTTWLSYSISRSLCRFPSINNGVEFPAITDQIHQLSWSNMLTVRKWNFGTVTLFSTGRPYYYYPATGPDPNQPIVRSYKRLPNYFRCDVSANYNFKLYKASFKAGATIINIFNTNNFYDVSTRNYEIHETSVSQTNLTRSQQRSFNLFLHFIL